MGRIIASLAAGLFLAVTASAAQAVEKFALIVGVDDQLQPENYSISVLKGPTNDVKLIRRLLVERYDFKDDGNHILTLTGKNATKKAIADAFKSQLIDKAKANSDAVTLFYFSGHGSQQDDVNNDESDGTDETLVAYDSRGKGGHDIVDDEIAEWFDSLSVHTKNAIFILDSCHSGTGTRGDAVARVLPTNPNAARRPGTSSGAKTIVRSLSPGWARNDKYTAIAGALAEEQSYEGPIKDAGGTSYGYLTWSLYQTLKLQPDLSWRQTMESVRRAVGQLTSQQHPQVEGDVERTAFGESGDRSQPYISIVSATGGGVTINGGRALGLSEGSLLAIYDPKAKFLIGDDKKLATARVTGSSLTISQATFVDQPSSALPPGAKVAIVTPYFGTAPLPIKLDALPDQATTPADTVLLGQIRHRLKDVAIVRPVSGAETWRYSVQKGCLNAKGELNIPKAALPSGCHPAYYLASPQTRDAALAYWAPATDPNLAQKLADAITALGRQAALRSLSNKSAKLDVRLHLIPVNIVKNALGESEALDGNPIPASGQPSLAVGDAFRFQIENLSSDDVWVTVIALETDGGIKVLTPAKTGDKVTAHTSYSFGTVLEAQPPLGIETYKIIATTRSGIDFSVLEMPGISPKGGSSPLEWLLTQATTTHARTTAVPGVSLNEWATTNLDVALRPAGSK
jgi:hypothetical protein